VFNIKKNAKLMEMAIDETHLDLSLLNEIHSIRKDVWDKHEGFNKKYDEWLEGNIKKLSVEDINKVVVECEQFCLGFKSKLKELAPKIKKVNIEISLHQGSRKSFQEMSILSSDDEEFDEVLAILNRKIDNMKEMLPMMSALCNKSLKDKHWLKILELIEGGTSLLGKVSISFQELASLGIKNYFSEIEEISAKASGESSIEQDLEKIKREWMDRIINVIPYRDFKDKFIVIEITEIFEKLDDDLLKIQSMLGSKFSSEIKDCLQTWERKLSLIHDTLEEWMQFQKKWMYLENVFSTDDIQHQLPSEYSKFYGMDKFWRETMLKVQKKPLILENISSQDIYNKFVESNKQMEVIQKMLEDYLELKRKLFPRFYFLSNDDLLEIFSQTRNPEAIQPHLRKCFDNIKAIQFEDSDEQKTNIIAMISAEPEVENEVVPFEQTVKTIGPIEQWLKSIEEMMCYTLFSRMREFLEINTDNYQIIDFGRMFEFPAQIVLIVNMIRWTFFSESHLRQNSLKHFLTMIQEQIARSVNLIKSDLSVGQRELIKNLIISDVHNRDIIERMIGGTATIDDFEWMKQLRYYWEAVDADMAPPRLSGQTKPKSIQTQTELGKKVPVKDDNCILRQTDTKMSYGFEYLGNSSRLVITPLTDKCYITLTSALNLTYGGAPAGPAGTGKTETTKDLAKAVAIVCIVFNCSDSLEYKTMGRFFSGLAQCGAWACFDEFNRINVEVLSVIAQQIMVIQSALREKREEFEFEGKIISLNLRFGVFITMNPGYAGRSELPDNLKSLFRPVAMMIPDYSLIAEIMLFSEGFQNAKLLSQKMVHMFKLSSEQLSKQKHYDFGMRAVKAVLNMAGLIRRSEPDTPEEHILLKALRDSNIPKFLVQDLGLFEGIINDLFPNTKLESANYQELIDGCVHYLNSLHYQSGDLLVTKIKQLYEVSNIRHGVMNVGRASNGKTTTLETLVSAVKNISTPIDVYKLNPKSLTGDELFGYNDIFTNNFTHGIVWKIINQALEENQGARKWIVFDGPVDAEWIENLNTVLDDNKMLCLPDGKRIKLPNSFSMIFEVENLNAASPATVSRCGMVYFDVNTVEPIAEFWTFRKKLEISLRDRFKPENKTSFCLDILFSSEVTDSLVELVTEVLDFTKQSGEQMIANVEISLLKNGLKLFELELEKFLECLSKKIAAIKIASNLEKFVKSFEAKEYIHSLFIFGLTWAFAGNFTENARQAFNKNFKANFVKKAGSLLLNIPSLFNFYFNEEKFAFINWKEIVPEFEFKAAISYTNILVETTETVISKYMLNMLTLKNIPVLLNGVTGVGKTAIIKNFLRGMPQNYIFSIASFSAQTIAKSLENSLEEKLTHRGKDLAPNAGKTLVFFIDDINMPKLDTYGTQSVNELVRQIIDHGGFYDMKKYTFRGVKNTTFLAACAPPEGGRNPMSQRMVRHFFTLGISNISEKSMEHIFGSIIKGYFGQNLERRSFNSVLNLIVSNSIQIYKDITATLLPTPKKCHYCFNLRDLSRVFQGMTYGESCIDTEEKLFSLWMHEEMRVFSDRLTDESDKAWFSSRIIKDVPLTTGFDANKLDFLNFSSIVSGQYSFIASEEELYSSINDSMAMFSSSFGKQFSLVLFTDAIKHICRIKRILSFSRGNALLLGISGCGKRSLATLSAFLNKNTIFSIELTKGYKFQTWRDDLKKVMKMALADVTVDGRKGVSFLISENQLIMDSFLEDVNNLLNIGEIPNLWAKEEIDEVIEIYKSGFKDKKELALLTKNELWEHTLNSFKDHFHLILTFSPVGNNFRSKCRQFPSLINCCTIDYFFTWPKEALRMVAESELKKNFSELPEPMIKQLASIFGKINSSVEIACDKFFDATRRKLYITPSSYITVLKTYAQLYQETQKILPQKIKTFETGLSKLAETKLEIETLQDKILAFQPQLEQAKAENEVLLADLEEKNKDATEKESVCQKEAEEISTTRNEVNELRLQCQKELNEALPALFAAQNAAKNIDKGYIATIKTYNVVAKDIEMVLCAVNLLFGKKETWDEVKKFLSDMEFIKKLQNLDPMTVKNNVWTKLRANYLSRPEFNPILLKEKVSEAVSTLANYCINMEIYYLKKKEVDPKEQALANAEEKLAGIEEEMNIKFSELNALKANVDSLNERLSKSLAKAKKLEEDQQRAKLHLSRAEKLLKGLDDESVRWATLAATLRVDETNMTGNMLLAASMISYLGPLNVSFREELLKEWFGYIKAEKIPVGDSFSIAEILSDPVTIKDWQMKGLPADNLSVENAVILMSSQKAPLLIDPQMQMAKWLKNVGKDSEIICIKYNNANLLKQIENAIRFGNTILIESVEENLDPSLDSALSKQVYKKGPQFFLKFNDQEIPYNSDFRIYLATKLQNPQYLPETTININLINCTVTEVGLQEQLLVEIVLNECPQLEEQRDVLIRQIAEDKKQLSEIQARILRLINEVQGNLLDEEELITTLDASKVTSEAINRRMKESEVTSSQISTARDVYRPLSKQGSILYFILTNLANVNYMYQFSLEYFISFFTQKMRENLELKNNPEARVSLLANLLTKFIFEDVCRGLYEKHKLLFAFMIAVKIQQSKLLINDKLWMFFAEGLTNAVHQSQAKTYPNYLPAKILPSLDFLGALIPSFKDLSIHFISYRSNFIDLLNREDLQLSDLDFMPSMTSATHFERLVLLKTLREEKLNDLVISYVKESLGQTFIDFPSLDLKSTILGSSPENPIVFILSSGADPLSNLLALAKDMEMEHRLKIISLGQGQGDRAKELIKASRLNGEWILLQNCHLAASWLVQLELLIENPSEEAHSDFRLFLTTMPCDYFPPAILNRATKLTIEPPKGIRANLRQIYTNIEEKDYNDCSKPEIYKPLLFCLSMFHSVILERKHFGSIGWNIPYEWMISDLETSQRHLKNYVEKNNHVPFEILTTLIGIINYGGRVTDYNDERTVTSILKHFFNNNSLTIGHSFDAKGEGAYVVPNTQELQEVMKFIGNLPFQDKPFIFGLNQNATINLELQLAREFRSNMLKMESFGSRSKDSESSDDSIVKLIDRMLEKLPIIVPYETSTAPSSPLIVFRNQEIERYAALIKKMKSSLHELRDAVKGLIAMSLELEDMVICFSQMKIPQNWEKLSYLSLKGLSSWFEDFIQRVSFINLWIVNSALKSYWISCFYFPQGFFTAVLQKYARDNQIPIDSLVFNTNILRESYVSDAQITNGPSTGANLHGFFLENAYWNFNKQYLEDSPPKMLIQEMPIVHFDPVLKNSKRDYGNEAYECPIYKTSERRGELSTTGHSTNFITYINLPIRHSMPDDWVKRGTAILLQKDD